MIPKTLQFIIIVTGVAVGLIPALNIPTSLYARCKNYSNWHPCLEHQKYPCSAKKVANGTFNNDVYKCRKQCPPPPGNVYLRIFKQPLFLGKQEMYTGVNLSWTVDATDDSYHFVDGFRVELRTVDHYLIKYVTVDVEHQPRDQDKIWVYYDCFYPVIKDRAWTVTVRTIPYNEQLPKREAKAEFVLDENGDSVLMTTTSEPVTSLGTSDDLLVISNASFDHAAFITSMPSSLSSKEDTKIIMYQPYYATVKTLGIIIGIMFGLLFIIIVAIVSVMIRQRYAAPSDSACLLKNNPKVILIYTKDSVNHVQKSQQLATVLSDICRVIDIWQVETPGDGDLLESLYETLNSADIIVTVYSHYIRQKIQHLSMAMQQPSRRSVEDLALYLMITSKKKPSPRVLTVYFPDTTTCNVIEGIDWPQPMALPANLHALRQQIQSPGPCGIPSADKDATGLGPFVNNGSIDSISLECSPGSGSPITEVLEGVSPKSSCFVPIFRPSAAAAAAPEVLVVPPVKFGPVPDLPSPPYAGRCDHHLCVAPRDLARAYTGLPRLGGVNSGGNSRWKNAAFQPAPPPFIPPRRWNSFETDIQSECLAAINGEQNCIHLDRVTPCQQLPVVATTAVSAGGEEERMSNAVPQQLSLFAGPPLSPPEGRGQVADNGNHSRWSF